MKLGIVASGDDTETAQPEFRGYGAYPSHVLYPRGRYSGLEAVQRS